MKGLFIPGITAETFRSSCLESIKVLMAAGKMYDVDISDKTFLKKESASEIRLNDTLNEIKAEIEKRKEGDYACFDDDEMQIFITGLNTALDIIDSAAAHARDFSRELAAL